MTSENITSGADLIAGSLRSHFEEISDEQYKRLLFHVGSPAGHRRTKLQEVKASQPFCTGEIYKGHLIEISLVSTHLKYGRLQFLVHAPNGEIVRPILNSHTGNVIKPNTKNPQMTIAWAVQKVKRYVDKWINTGMYNKNCCC